MRLLVDISGLAYRSAHKLSLTDRSGASVGAVFGTLRSIEHLAELTDPEEIIICWDAGHVARSELYPEYKANRRNRDPEWQEDFERQKVVLRQVLDLMPVTNIEEPGVEADDCIAALCAFMRPEEVAIVTGDRDLYQLADPPRHTVLDYDGVAARLEFKPSQYVTYKVLVGDSSDNVKGVLGLGDKTARRLMKEHRTLRQIMAWAAEAPDEKRLGRMTYDEAVPIVKRNLQLIRLTDTPLLTAEQRHRICRSYATKRLDRRLRRAELQEQLRALGFKSILRRFGRFALNFKGMERIAREAKVEEHAGEAVHQAHPQSGRQWRRIRKLKGADDRGAAGRGKAAPTDHIRRIRKVKDKSPQAGRRWRRVRRVVAPSDRARGKARGRDDGEGEPALALAAGAAKAKELDSSNGHGRAAGALSDLARQARASVARRRAKKLSDLQEVSQSEPVRSERALSMLSSLQGDFDWLKHRPDEDLKRVVRIIRWYERDKGYTPSEEDTQFLEQLIQERGMEMPDWMLTEEEQEAKSVPVASMDVWDFASSAIANMGRRRERKR